MERPASKREEATTLLTRVLQLMGMEMSVTAREDEERILLDIQGPEAALLIGKKGQTLDALQLVVDKAVNRELEGRTPIVVDIEGYRGRREEALVELAHRLGEKVKRTQRAVELESMSSRDRRVVHLALEGAPGVTTRSEGEGTARRLLIVPAPEKQA